MPGNNQADSAFDEQPVEPVSHFFENVEPVERQSREEGFMEEDELEPEGLCQLIAKPLELSPGYPRPLARQHRAEHNTQRVAHRKGVVRRREEPPVYLA